MTTYEFTIIADPGENGDFGDLAERLFAAGCDDATVSIQKRLAIVEFDRDARTFSHALKSALSEVAGVGLQVRHVEPDPLVSLSDIAVRAGLTRAAASLYAKGARGKAFPTPVARVTTESPLWDWVAVARWLFRQGRLPLSELLKARVVRNENAALQSATSRRANLAAAPAFEAA